MALFFRNRLRSALGILCLLCLSWNTWSQTYDRNYTDNLQLNYFDKLATVETYNHQFMTIQDRDGNPAIIRTDQTGAVLWEKSYDVTGFATSTFSNSRNHYSIQEVEVDGEKQYVACMTLFLILREPQTWVYLLSVDGSGVPLWHKVYKHPFTRFGHETMEMLITSDDHLLISGWHNPPAYHGETFLLKTDFQGNTAWYKHYQVGEDVYMEGRDVVETSDGYMLTGGIYDIATNNYEHNPFLLKTDFDGNTQWLNEYPVPEEQVIPQALAVDENDDLYVVSLRSNPGFGTDPQLQILKTDNSGLPIWNNSYQELDNHKGIPVDALYDEENGLIVAGEVITENTPVMGWLMNINRLGTPYWSKLYEDGLGSNRRVHDLIQLKDDGFMLTNYAITPEWNFDALNLLRTDEFGSTGGCEQAGDLQVAPLSAPVVSLQPITESFIVEDVPELPPYEEIDVDYINRCCPQQPLEITTGGPYCTTDGPVTFSANWTGGWWDGAVDHTGTFNPAAAGPGRHLVEYCFKNDNCCDNCVTKEIVVYDCDPGCQVAVASPGVAQMCAGPVTLVALPVGGTWTGPNVFNGNQVDVANLAPGTYNYTYCAQSGSCIDCETTTLTVVASCETADCAVSVSPDQNVTPCDPPMSLFGSPVGGTWYGPNQTNGSFDPFDFDPGLYTFTYCYQDPTGCIACDEVQIQVDPCPDQCNITIPPVGPISQCDFPFSIFASPSNSTSHWSGPNIFSGTIYPSQFEPGIYEFTYCYTHEKHGCCCETIQVEITACESEGKRANEVEGELIWDEELKLFPNPNTGEFQVTGTNLTGNVTIMDMTGRPLKRFRNTNETQINIESTAFANGVYFFVLEADSGKRAMMRFMVQ